MSIFISYSRFEFTFADSLFQELERTGSNVWIDQYRLQPGYKWQDQILDNINSADTFVLVVSQHALESKEVVKEINHAYAQGKRIILIVFEVIPLAGHGINAPLATCEYVDFRRRFDDALRDLVQLLQREPQPTRTPVPQTGDQLPPGPFRLILVSIAPALLTLLSVLIALWGVFDLNGGLRLFLSLGAIAVALPRLLAPLGFHNPMLEAATRLIMPFQALPVEHAIRERHYRYWGLFSKLVINTGGTLFVILVTAAFVLFPYEDLSSAQKTYGVLSTLMLLATCGAFVYQVFLLGSADLYRWAGPQGIPAEEFDSWNTPHLRIPLIITAIGILGVLFVPSLLIKLFAGILFIVGMVGAFSVRLLLRGTSQYRRASNLATGSIGETLQVFVDYASQNSSAAHILERALAERHTVVTDRANATTIVTLLSKHLTQTSQHEPTQTMIPVLIDGDFSTLDPAISALQVIDWRDGITNTRADQLCAALDTPQKLARISRALPQKAFGADRDRRQIRGARLMLITRAATGFSILLMIFYMLAIQEEHSSSSGFLEKLFDAMVPMGIMLFMGARLFIREVQNAAKRMVVISMIAGSLLLMIVRGDAGGFEFAFQFMAITWAVPLVWSFIDAGAREALG